MAETKTRTLCPKSRTSSQRRDPGDMTQATAQKSLKDFFHLGYVDCALQEVRLDRPVPDRGGGGGSDTGPRSPGGAWATFMPAQMCFGSARPWVCGCGTDQTRHRLDSSSILDIGNPRATRGPATRSFSLTRQRLMSHMMALVVVAHDDFPDRQPSANRPPRRTPVRHAGPEPYSSFDTPSPSASPPCSPSSPQLRNPRWC